MAQLTTPLCARLGIVRPIVQAPITASPELIAAVSNAGGLGMLQATWLDAETTWGSITAIRDKTDRPFGANFVVSLMGPAEHANLDMVLEAGVPVVSTFWGDPAPLVARIHDAGALSFHTVGSAEEARRAVDAGVDVVVAQGVEAGGHVWGQVSTLVLVPAVADAVPGTPVIAAGGIADGRGLAAVLALGAQAAWVGTRFLMATENMTHPDFRARLVEAKETDTILSSLFDVGWPDAPHRTLVNDTVRDWIAAGRPPTGVRPNEGEILGRHADGTPVVRYSFEEPGSDVTGDVAAMCLYAGQGIGLIHDEKPVARIIEDMVGEAANIISRVGNS